MLDRLIKEYGDACAQKQKAKDHMRSLIAEAREHRVYPTLHQHATLKSPYFLNEATSWIKLILQWEMIVKWKKENLLQHIADMELYKDAA